MERMACSSMGLFFFVATACIAMSARLSAGQGAAPAPGLDCTSDLVQLFPCFDFLTNNSVSSVVPTCCAALKNVSSSSSFCLCQLISPAFSNQGAQLGINDSRALQLPGLCSLSLSPASCAAVLGPSAAPSPLALVPVSAPVPISIVPSPSRGAPVSSPRSSAAPGPAVDCNIEIATLSGCLTFLSGSVTTPSATCCTNLGTVVSTAPQCLCSLAQSPVVSTVNATLVQTLPSLCSVSASLSECVGGPSTTPLGSEGPGNYGAKSATSPNLYVVIALCVLAFAHALLQ